MLDDRNRVLAQVAHVDDVVVSGEIVSLLVTQLSEDHRLEAVFERAARRRGQRDLPAARRVVRRARRRGRLRHRRRRRHPPRRDRDRLQVRGAVRRRRASFGVAGEPGQVGDVPGGPRGPGGRARRGLSPLPCGPCSSPSRGAPSSSPPARPPCGPTATTSTAARAPRPGRGGRGAARGRRRGARPGRRRRAGAALPARPGAGADAVVVHLHGGGFVFNDVDVHDAAAPPAREPDRDGGAQRRLPPTAGAPVPGRARRRVDGRGLARPRGGRRSGWAARRTSTATAPAPTSRWWRRCATRAGSPRSC